MQIYNFSLKPRIPPEKASVQEGFRDLCPRRARLRRQPPRAAGSHIHFLARRTDLRKPTYCSFFQSATTLPKRLQPLGCSDTDGRDHFTNCVKFHIIALPIYNDCDTFAKVAFSQPSPRTDTAPQRHRGTPPRFPSPGTRSSPPPRDIPFENDPCRKHRSPRRRAPNTTNPYTPQILNEV